MGNYPLEKTKICACGVMIKVVKSCGKYVALNVNPTIIHIAEYGFGRRSYRPVSGYENHKFTCAITNPPPVLVPRVGHGH